MGFGCGIFFGRDFFAWNFWTCGLRLGNIFSFFLACDFSWNDELNFCVAEPQELG